MKAAVVFVLLFASVLCRPARKVSESDSDSSEEAVRRPAAPALRRHQLVVPKSRPAPVQKVAAAPAKAASDESEDASDEAEEAEAAPVEVKAAAALPTADTGSVTSEDSEDDEDDDDHEEEESETEEEESDSDSQSGESSTPAPVTATPTPGVVEPETTQDYVEPTIVTDPDAGRGDSLGAYPDDYKSVVYVEEKSYHKAPNPYKSYEIVGKKVAYDLSYGNEVEKTPKVYKVQAFQIQSELLEEDTSTPEVETQGLDASSGLSQDQDASARQAALPAEEASASSGASSANESDSSSTPEEEEEEEEGASAPSDSASAESEDRDGQSSEEAAATPGAADSDSDEDDSAESDSDSEEGAGPDAATDAPVVVTAK